MGRRLVRLLVAVLLVVMGGDRLCAAPAEAIDPAERSLALLQQVDLQTLAPAERQALLLGVADQLQAAGRPLPALDLLARALTDAGPPPPAAVLDRIRGILTRLDRATLEQVAARDPGGDLAGQARSLLAGQLLATLPSQAGYEVGVLLPLSGRYAPFGQAVQQGLELTRTAGSPLRFVYRDTAAGADVATLVDELAARPGLLAVIGPLLSAEAGTAAARAAAARLPLLLLAPREGTTGGWVFRNALTPAAQVRVLAEFARQQEGLGRFVIFHPADRQGELYTGLFRAAVEQLGGQVVARQSYPPGTIDLREPLQALAAAVRRSGSAPPDALFIPDEARQVAQIVPQLAFPKLDQLQLLGTSGWHDPDLGRMAGPLSEGAVFVDGFFADSPWPQVREFAAAFRAAHDAPPNLLNAQGYDAGRLMLTLLSRPGLHDRESLRQALAGLRDFPGATGMTAFGPDGEAQKNLFLLQVQNGLLVQIN